MNQDHLFILKDLRRKLHDPRGPKAAVMVGSGFSLNAIPRFGGGRRFPLWRDLTGKLIDGLYTNPDDRRCVLESSGATSSALRLAEEYESAFGRSALIEIVREETTDDDFIPSPLHEKLVDLPWADIFTTNYDRLIERAALNSPGRSMRRFRYEVVSQAADIPLARRPRIVKLHGTLPDLANLVLTEEDFRCYGHRQAAFVNAVRASMSENAFCLLGFSGDDPNFLAWSGWIRDTLRESTPTVYLFCTTPPAPFKRKLLEQRNVLPIPLSFIFDTKDVATAVDRLLEFLGQDPGTSFVAWNRPPDEVQLTSHQESSDKEPSSAEELGWIESALIWRHNRLAFQGWEVLHRLSMNYLWGRTEFSYQRFSAKAMHLLRLNEKLLVVREMLWRLSMCLLPISDDRVEQILDPLVAEIETNLGTAFDSEVVSFGQREVKIGRSELIEGYRYVLGQLIRHAREIGSRAKFDRLTRLLHLAPDVTREEQCFAEYQDLLFRLGSLDLDTVRRRLRNWDVYGLPAIWTVRRCGLLLEVGEASLAREELLKLIDSLVSTKAEPTVDYRRHSVEALALYQMELVNWWERNFFRSSGAGKVKQGSDEFQVRQTVSTLGEAENPKESTFGDDESDSDTTNDSRTYNFPLKIARRLRELNELGCDPNEMLNQFNDLFQHFELQGALASLPDKDEFDVRRTTFHHRSLDLKHLRDAYRMIRFVEESGIPISIHAVSQLNTRAMPPFLAAAKLIGSVASREAAGPVLRSGEGKLAKNWLDRASLASMESDQVADLLGQIKLCFNRSLERLVGPKKRRDTENQWWERQLRFSCVMYARLVTRLSDDQLRSIAADVLLLAGRSFVWKLIGTADDIQDLVRRVATCLPNGDLLALTPSLLALPVAGDAEADFDNLPTNDWIDPLSQFDSSDRSREDADLSDQVSETISRIATASGAHRRNLVLRIVTLWHCGFLSNDAQRRFRDALFAKCDGDGFPEDTGCYDSLILGLPKEDSIDETRLYQSVYVEKYGEANLSYWANLSRSVDRDREVGLHRRSINWTSKDLQILVSRTSDWASKMQAKEKEENGQPAFVRSMVGDGDRIRKQAIREWLSFVAETILISDKFKGRLRTITLAAISDAETAGICTVRLIPFLIAGASYEINQARTAIRQALLSEDEFVSWQGYSAIVQWGRLTRKGRLQWSPGLESLLGSTILIQRDDHLVLPLTAARELLEVYPEIDSPHFFDDLIGGLKALARELDYSLTSHIRIETKIRIRIACVKLAMQLLEVGRRDKILNEWMELAKADCFAEVRRAATM